ncbi:PqqD family protein [Thermoplasmatales archaeon ex4484_30]|nr:MAG: PqqD family protein [Thermoplasmata archaeon]OYT61806.1 MAG: PqqD family protein [Thermoplasmatales archaeon ex4484_30]
MAWLTHMGIYCIFTRVYCSERIQKGKRRMKIDWESKPARQVDWFEEKGLVKLKILKFKSRIGKWMCKILKRPNYFLVNLDEIGSFIWKRCNGKNTVEDILKELEGKYGKEMMKERLLVFLQMLKRNGYIEYK